MRFDFDEPTCRLRTNSVKWDETPRVFNIPAGDDIIPMWVADTDFRCPPEVLEAVHGSFDAGMIAYKYLSPAFAEAVAGWMLRRHGLEIDPEWVLPLPSVVSGISAAMCALTEPGDEVIIQTPVYGPFMSVPSNCGRVVLDNKLIERCGDGRTLRYDIDFEGLEELAARPRAKMMVLCSPHNPVGRIFTPDELARIIDICRRNGVFLVSDEIHADVIISDRFTPILSVAGESRAAGGSLRGICQICSPSKSFNTPGSHAAYMIVPDRDERRRIDEFWDALHIPNCSFICEEVVSAAYNRAEYYVDELCEYIAGNVAYMTDFIKTALPAARVADTQATYLMWADLRGCGIPDREIVRVLCEKARVALQPGEWFHRDYKGYVRINVAAPRARLEEAARRIKAVYDEYASVPQ